MQAINDIPGDVLKFVREYVNPYYREAFKYNMTETIKRQFAINKDERLNLIISIWGTPGSAKSTVAWVIAEWNCNVYKKKMVATNMFFDDAQLLNALETSKPGDIKVKDEQPDIYGEGSLQVASNLQNIERTVRDSEVSLIYCGPELKLHCHHYVIRPALKLYRFNKNLNYVLSWVFDGLKEGGKYPVGYIITGLPEGTKIDNTKKRHRDRIIFPEEYNKYLMNKRNFIKSVKRGELSSGSEFFLDEMAERFIKDYENLEDIKTNKRLEAILKTDKRFRRNFTGGQIDTLSELVKIKCENKGIKLGIK